MEPTLTRGRGGVGLRTCSVISPAYGTEKDSSRGTSDSSADHVSKIASTLRMATICFAASSSVKATFLSFGLSKSRQMRIVLTSRTPKTREKPMASNTVGAVHVMGVRGPGESKMYISMKMAPCAIHPRRTDARTGWKRNVPRGPRAQSFSPLADPTHHHHAGEHLRLAGLDGLVASLEREHHEHANVDREHCRRDGDGGVVDGRV
eukprot:3231818-Pleurochrysis_carterae.AAC.1